MAQAKTAVSRSFHVAQLQGVTVEGQEGRKRRSDRKLVELESRKRVPPITNNAMHTHTQTHTHTHMIGGSGSG